MAFFTKRRSTQAQAVALLEALAAGKRVSGLTLPAEDLAHRARELAKPNDILFHGKRVEAMFAFVAASLGKCSLIHEEDAGDVYAIEDVQPPDYRIVLRDGGEILVEVKNCHNHAKPFVVQASYIAGLAAYGRIANRPLKLAIYWSRFREWTLVPLDALGKVGKKRTISFPEAIMANEMAALGDHMIGTRPPLAIRLYSDPTKPRTASAEGGNASFTIGKVELYCGGRLVTDKFEKQIVLHFMLFGRWPQTCPAEIIDDEFIWAEFVAEPEQDWEEQGFAIVGNASSMISAHFNIRTVSMSGTIERLRPLADPSKFGIEIPRDYSGNDVPLWRFTVHSKSAGDEGEHAPRKP